MPTPRSGESRDEWMTRCVPALVSEGKDQEQAIAACINIHRDSAMPELPEALTANTWDRHFTALVDRLVADGARPDEKTGDRAFAIMVEQFRKRFPKKELPEYAQAFRGN